MINIILLSLIFNILLNLIFPYRKNILCCGLFAWIGKDPENFNKDKFDKLGIYNDSRGGHSCGVSTDGEIYVGTDSDKLFKDFITNKSYSLPKKIPTVIGHDRKASFGKRNVKNAHPLGIGKEGNEFGLIAVHNGTLINYSELAKSNSIGEIDSDGDKKIDSQILFEILYKNKDISVLNEYLGTAALIWTFPKEPNKVYCYHGKSSYNSYTNYESEERPLYFLQISKNNSYISSMKNSLESINEGNHKVKEFKHNTVYEITDGNIKKAKKYKVDRSDRYQRGISTKKSNYKTPTIPIKNRNKVKNNKIITLKDKKVNIHYEETIKNINDYKSNIYFNKLRYWRNGHLLNGIYTWVDGYGFTWLAENVTDISNSIDKICNTPFINGSFDYSKGITTNEYIPFVKTKNKNNVPVFYFVDGIRVESAIDYLHCKEAIEDNRAFTTEAMTHCSTHPLIDLNEINVSNYNQNIMRNGDLFTGTIKPLGSDKIYRIVNGNCVNMKTESSKKVKTIDEIDCEMAENDLEKEINGYLLEEKNKKNNNKKDTLNEKVKNDLAEKEIESIFEDFYRECPRYIKRLLKFKDLDKIQHAIDILEEFKNETTNLIALDTNN